MIKLKSGLFISLLWCLLPINALQAADFWTCPTEFAGEDIYILNWKTYIAEDTIANFEALCDVTVHYQTFGSSEEMFDYLTAEGAHYDVAVPIDASIPLMVEQNLLQPLEMNRIPNFANVGEKFKNPPYDPQNLYSVAYQWDAIGLGYNKTKVGRELTSWQEVFDYPGKVAWLDDPRTMIGAALTLLGYSPNTVDPNELDAARQFLIAHSSNVVTIAADNGQDLLAAGEVDIALEYSGDIFQLIDACKCDDFAYLIPKEGAVLEIGLLVVPSTSQNPKLAATFIDYVLDKQVSANISNYTAYATANQVAIDEGLIYEDYLTNPGIYPPESVIQNLYYVTSTSEMADLYQAVWDAVKAAVES